jgi:hypothetical protein
MLKRQRRRIRELFLAGSRKNLIPEDPLLKKIGRITRERAACLHRPAWPAAKIRPRERESQQPKDA